MRVVYSSRPMVFNCGDMQYFGTRVSLKRSDDFSREREFDALYVGTRAVLLNQARSSPRIDDGREFEEFLRSKPVRALLSAISGAADHAGVLVTEHCGGYGDLSDPARDLRPGDGRRGDAGAQPERGTQPA